MNKDIGIKERIENLGKKIKAYNSKQSDFFCEDKLSQIKHKKNQKKTVNKIVNTDQGNLFEDISGRELFLEQKKILSEKVKNMYENEEKNIVKESNEKVAIVSEALNKKNDSIRRIFFKR